MAGEKYIIAAAENPFHITVRNILNPLGYMFMDKCSDYASLMRMVRSYNPDFIIVDGDIRSGGLYSTLETIDEELLCSSIVISQYKDAEISNLLEKTRALSFCQKPLDASILITTVDITLINFRRVCNLNKKLQEMTENYETRKAVERAKWILMKRDGLSEDEAYKRIRKKSMDARVSLKSVAEAIICTYEITK